MLSIEGLSFVITDTSLTVDCKIYWNYTRLSCFRLIFGRTFEFFGSLLSYKCVVLVAFIAVKITDKLINEIL